MRERAPLIQEGYSEEVIDCQDDFEDLCLIRIKKEVNDF